MSQRAFGLVMLSLVSITGCKSATDTSASTTGTSSPSASPTAVSSSTNVSASPTVSSSAKTSLPPSASGTTDPCKALTKAIAEKTLGGAVGSPTTNSVTGSGGSIQSCQYLGAGSQKGAVYVGIAHDNLTPEEFDRTWSKSKEAREISGIGDRAFLAGGELTVRRGNDKVIVRLIPTGRGAPTDDQLRELTKAILANI